MAKKPGVESGKGARIVEFKPNEDDVELTRLLLKEAAARAEAVSPEGVVVIMVGRETHVAGFTRDTRARERLLGSVHAWCAGVAQDINDAIDWGPHGPDDDDEGDE